MKRTRAITTCAVFSAISAVLMYLELSVPFVPSFLKFDLSDLPALITSFSCGPIWGAAVCLIKNSLHLFVSMTGGVGELANFFVGAAFVVTAGLIYKKKKTRTFAILGAVAGTVVSAAVSFPVNLFLTYPAYFLILPETAVISMYSAILPAANTIPKALLFFNIPFNLIKGLISTVITIFVYKPLSRIIKR